MESWIYWFRLHQVKYQNTYFEDMYLHIKIYFIIIIENYNPCMQHYFLETGPNKLTVGKIFGGMLILENWKLTRFMPIPTKKGGATLPVSINKKIYF